MDNVHMDYFTAAWCGPCRSVKPIVHELQDAGWNINIIDSDANRAIVLEKQVAGIPTFIIYKDGVQVDRFTGARSKTSLLEALRKAAEKSG